MEECRDDREAQNLRPPGSEEAEEAAPAHAQTFVEASETHNTTMLPRKFSIAWREHRIVYNVLEDAVQTGSANNLTDIRPRRGREYPADTDSQHPVFEPVCLTVFLNHQCNLDCRYCYVPEKKAVGMPDIDPGAVRAAAGLVAANCARLGSPFVLGFHGGNEPLLNQGLIDQCIRVCREVAEKHRLTLLPVCSTNGVITEETARWAALNFHGITLSWDGPDELHDRYRIQRNGSPTALAVRRTAAILAEAPSRLRYLRVRATVTAESVHRLAGIVEFFARRSIRLIDLYPVYQDKSHSLDAALIPESWAFAGSFLKARTWASGHGIRLGYAGSRFADRHGQFCPVLQENLTITPDGFATACFLVSHNRGGQNDAYIYGSCGDKQDGMAIDREKLHGMLGRLAQVRAQCATCFNRTHCSKGCPSVCPLRTNPWEPATCDCTIERTIGLANIIEAAGIALPEEATEDCRSFFTRINVESIH